MNTVKCGGDTESFTPKGLYVFIFLILSIALISTQSLAQEKHLVQIKTFDETLNPFANIEISINGKPHIAMGARGVAFAELSTDDLPPKTVTVKDEDLEAASWNYSKGIVQIIIRKKNYQHLQIYVRDDKGKPLPNLSVTFNGKKAVTTSTDRSGKFEVILALDEKITSAAQFSITDHKISDLILSDKEKVIIASLVKSETTAQQPVPKAEIKSEYFKDFDLTKLDSIQSLTAFYAIFKNYSWSEFDDDIKAKLDVKLNQLVRRMQDSVKRQQTPFIGRISDSSFVSDDIRNLLDQARLESQTLEGQRREFDEKIRIINEKLAQENLDPATRSRLLTDLSLLEKMLKENEDKFYKNQNDYRSILNSLKEKFFHIETLENKLSASEAQRLEEQRIFRQRLITIVSIAAVFALLIILLIYFSNKLKKQKQALVVANAEVKRINENLEGLIFERTRLLQEANNELDTFLYRASHDLRSPVCSIIGLCNIATQVPGPEQREIFEKAVYTAHSMDKLLKKLRIISEINQPGNYAPISLFDMVNDIRQNFQSIISKANIQFNIYCPQDLNFFSNKNLIEAILSNLIENALFYSSIKKSSEPQVEFKAGLRGDHLEFSIYDNGVGIDPAIQTKLYDMFFKGHEKSKGNGLGLYIVQKSVLAVKGSITLESEWNQFTKFIVRIPLATTPAIAAVVQSAKKGESSKKLVAMNQ